MIRIPFTIGAVLLATAIAARSACGDHPMRQFRAGAATSNLTPKLGTSINGGMRDGTATHVHDELHARCLVLDDGDHRLAFAVVDACMLPRAVTDPARRFVEAETGIPASHVLISATHSHSCGTCAGVFQSEPDTEYPPFVARRIADGIRRAVNNLAPAKIGWGAGQVPDEVFNRRYRMKPGTRLVNPFGGTDQVKMNPGAGNPEVVEPAGPTDPEVFVLSVRHTDGRPLALLANYSLHYVGGVGPGHLSADYYGMFAERVRRLEGEAEQDPPFVAMMSNGTSGDINNIHVQGAPAAKPQAPYEQMHRVAEKIAAEAIRVEKQIHFRDWVPVAAEQSEISLGVRKASVAELARARTLLAAARPGEPLRTQEEIYARESVLLADYPDRVPVILQVMRIGDLAIAAAPCEVFVEIGLELKRRSPIRPMFTISLANGYHGYLPTPEHHALGGYETWRARSSYLEVQASRRITDELLGLLNRLRQ